MICKKCGNEINDSAQFCKFCGEKIVKMCFCPDCGSIVDKDDVFCESCGYKLKDNTNVITPDTYEDNVSEEVDNTIEKIGKTIFDYDFGNEEKQENPDEETYEEQIEENQEIIDEENSYQEEPDFVTEKEIETEEEKPVETKKMSFDDIVANEHKETNEVEFNKKPKEKANTSIGHNLIILIVSVICMTFLFMPFYAKMNTSNTGYISSSMGKLKEDYFLNPISFTKLFGKTNILNESIDKFLFGILFVGSILIFIGLFLVIVKSLKAIKNKTAVEKYIKPLMLNFTTTLVLWSLFELNSVFIYLSLSLYLAVLLYSIITKKLDVSFGKMIIFALYVALFVAFRYAAITDAYSTYEGFSKLAFGKYFELNSEFTVDPELEYVKDLIKFLGWTMTGVIVLSIALLCLSFVKYLLVIDSKENKKLPSAGFTVNIVLFFVCFIVSIFAKNKLEEYSMLVDRKFNTFFYAIIFCEIALCVIVGFNNYKFKKNKKSTTD